MKTKLALLFTAVAILLGACSDSSSTRKASASKKIEYKKISESAIKQTVADMKSRDHVKDASFTVKENKIKMKLVVDDPNLTDDKTAIKYADTYLRAISMYVDDNHPTADSYGKVYDGYYVDIVVEDPNGMQAVEGKMYPGLKGITWE